MVVDWGYRATHLMTVVAKQIAKAYYQRDAQQSYFTGWVGDIANTAHAVGLIVGIAWGFLSAKLTKP